MDTVRARTTALATLVAGLTLVLASVALVLVLDAQLTGVGDAAARVRVREISRVLVAGRATRVLPPVGDDGMVQVVTQDGAVLGASPNVAGRPPVTPPATAPEAVHVLTARGPDDEETEDYRIWRSAVRTPAGIATVQVGTSLESVHEATRRLRTALLLGVPVVLLLLALATWWVVGRALGRVEDVRRQVAAISDEDLGRRVRPGPPDEVGRLVETMNQMLTRLEEGRRRQRDFVADASHELQSPLTAFRTQLEVARAHPDGVDWPRLADALLEDSDRMERLVRDLLVLASTEAGVRPVAAPVDLARLVRDEAKRAGAAGRVSVRVEPGPAETLGDERELGRAVGNVLDNAVRHARSEVRIRTATQDDWAVVTVADDGPGVPAGQEDEVFERFHRGDVARTRSHPGTGLGLPIARELARRHGGDVVLRPQADLGGARFELRLPARGP